MTDPQMKPVNNAGQPAFTSKKPSVWKLVDWKMMSALLFPSLLETLDYTVVAAVQPRIASVFNQLSLQSYIGTAYLLSSSVFLPFFASVADIYGRYFGFQVSLFLFLIGSAIATGATNMPMVLGGRGLAGVGAAGLLTIVRTVLSDTNSLDANNIQQSCLLSLYSIGFTVGPVIGGFLVEANWRWVFAINLPCTGIAMFLSYLFLRGRPSQSHAPPTAQTWVSKLVFIDWIGTVLFCVAGVLILLALGWGPEDNWKSARVIASIVIGVVSLVLCIAWERILERKRYSSLGTSGIYQAQPMLPMLMFSTSDSCIAQYGAFVSGIVMFVMFYFVSIFATIVTGLSAAQSGIQLLYFSPGLGVGSFLAIIMIKRFRQPIYPIVIGSAIMTVALGLVSSAVQRNKQGEVDGFLALAGFGVALTTAPLSIHARFKKPNHIAITNAMLLFFRALGGTIGLAQCYTVLNSKVTSYITAQINSGAVSGSDLEVLLALINSGGLTSITTLGGLPSDVQTIIRDSYRGALYWCFISLVPWAGLATILSMFLSNIVDTDAASEHTIQHGVEMEPKFLDAEAEFGDSSVTIGGAA